MERMIAFCGLDCYECPAYIATRADDDKKREELAEKWSSEEYKLKKEDIDCDGCLASEGRLMTFCRECEVRSCGAEKSVDNCGRCEDYGCEKLTKLWAIIQNPSAKENLEKARRTI
jgi:hypothetical protein